VPVDQDLFEDALYSLAARRCKLDLSSLNDPRLPENIYATAISHGALEYMHYAEDD